MKIVLQQDVREMLNIKSENDSALATKIVNEAVRFYLRVQDISVERFGTEDCSISIKPVQVSREN